MPDESEFQTAGAATLKLREAKVFRMLVVLDPETGPQWSRTLFLFLCLLLGLLLSDFPFPKALSFLNRL